MFRSGGRRTRRLHPLEETTSMDEHKSMTSNSSMLTVDVTREMEAVNRDIEEIIRKCDDYCLEGLSPCKACCLHQNRRINKGHRGLTAEQIRILSMKRPPLERLKEVPLSMLKPRPPRHCVKEKSLSAPHTKFKTSRDIRDIVEETDALLRNVYKELSRGKRVDEEEGCHCEGTRGVTEPRPATCLERYLGCQNKCRRLQQNRWIRPKWKDMFDKCDLHKIMRPSVERTKHFHDTNCISEPTTSSCFIRAKNELQNVPKTRILKDAGVNTESSEVLTKSRTDTERSHKIDSTVIELKSKELPENTDNKYPDADLQSVRAFKNYTSDKSSRASCFKTGVSDRTKSGGERYEPRTIGVEEESSLLLDRNMGLSLNDGSNLKTSQPRTDCGARSSGKEEESMAKSPDTFLSHHYFGLKSRSGYEGGGDSAPDSSRGPPGSAGLLTQVITKIVNKPLPWTQHLETVVAGKLEKQEVEPDEVDTATCLEIMKRLVDLMARHHQNQITDFGEVAAQYARVRKMKQQHLVSIEKEINSIQDLEL